MENLIKLKDQRNAIEDQMYYEKNRLIKQITESFAEQINNNEDKNETAYILKDFADAIKQILTIK